MKWDCIERAEFPGVGRLIHAAFAGVGICWSFVVKYLVILESKPPPFEIPKGWGTRRRIRDLGWLSSTEFSLFVFFGQIQNRTD